VNCINRPPNPSTPRRRNFRRRFKIPTRESRSVALFEPRFTLLLHSTYFNCSLTCPFFFLETMSTSEIFGRLATTYLKPPKPRSTFNPVRHPKARLRDLKPVLRPGQLDRAPSVFPWIQPKIVQKETETEKHLRKTRLQPHMRKWRCHVTLLAGKQGMEQDLMPFAWMKMRVKDIKMVEQAGGLEAKMVGRHAAR
jgi:hypothetical protein